MYQQFQKRTAMLLCLTAWLFFVCPGATSAEDTQEYQLDEITVTAARIEEPLAKAPAIIKIISADDLNQKNPRTLGEALNASDSGVRVNTSGTFGSVNTPYILGSNKVLILVDGKRMNLPQGTVDLSSYIINDNVDHIEILEGGASTLYGSDAIGGVINIITKKGSGQTAVSAAAGFGSNYAQSYAINANGQTGNHHFQFSANRNSTDGQRPNSAYAGNAAALRYDFDLSDNSSITVTYNYFNSLSGYPGSAQYLSATDFGKTISNDWSIGYSKTNNGLEQLYRYYGYAHNLNGQNFGYFNYNNYVNALEYQDGTAIKNNDKLLWRLEYTNEQVTGTNFVNGGNYRNTGGVVIQDTHNFGDNDIVSAGVRGNLDNVYGGVIAPEVSYTHLLNDRNSLFITCNKAYRAPSFNELYYESPYGKGNPNLKPEQGWVAELGTKNTLSDNLTTSAALFYRKINDAIVWETDPTTWLSTPYNIDTLTAYGLNLNLGWQFLPWAKFDFGYTIMTSYDQNNNASGLPDNCFNSGLAFNTGGLSQSFSGSYQSASGIVPYSVGAFFVLNSQTNYTVNDNTTLYLNMNNLLNNQYQFVYGYPADGFTMIAGIKQLF
ncbi:MAG: TonB-dependent receptor [Negativicutes bacterium]